MEMDENIGIAKVCCVCGDSFMTDRELNNFCAKCFREQSVDLLIMEAVTEMDPTERIIKLKERVDTDFEKVQRRAEERLEAHNKKSRKSLRATKILFGLWAALIFVYIGFQVYDANYLHPVTDITEYKTSCHKAEWYVAGDGDYRCSACERDVTPEVLHILEDIKGIPDNQERVINKSEAPVEKQEL